MISKIAGTAFQVIDQTCEYIGGNSLRQTLWASTGLILTNTLRLTVTHLLASNIILYTLAKAIDVLCIATLCKNLIQWRNVVIFLLGITVLSPLGIYWNNENKERLYQEKSYKDWGQLSYELDSKGNSHPTVSLFTKDPYQKGVALGMLTASQVIYVYKKVMAPLTAFAQLCSGDLKGEWLDRKVQLYKIPNEYELEMQGLVDGVNQWCVDNKNTFRLTYDMVKRVHCFTDTYKMAKTSLLSFDLANYFWNVMLGDMGCSTIVEKRDGIMTAARNLDWPGMGLGKYGFIRRDVLDDGQIVQSHIYPGVIAVMTAVKINQGNICLTAFVNESPERSMGIGIPCGLWVRKCIESCSTLKDVEKFANNILDPVASSFHLIVADGNDASDYQMHPREGMYSLKRNIADSGNLVVTNHFLDPESNEILDNVKPAGTSGPRFNTLSQLVNSNIINPVANLTSRCLQAVNRPLTLSSHRYTFGPVREGIEIVIADAWAANQLLV